MHAAHYHTCGTHWAPPHFTSMCQCEMTVQHLAAVGCRAPQRKGRPSCTATHVFTHVPRNQATTPSLHGWAAFASAHGCSLFAPAYIWLPMQCYCRPHPYRITQWQDARNALTQRRQAGRQAHCCHQVGHPGYGLAVMKPDRFVSSGTHHALRFASPTSSSPLSTSSASARRAGSPEGMQCRVR